MANRPKGKLFALLAIFVAIGLVTATGAFTTVQAERTATIGVSGDSAALLAIDGASNGPAGDIVTEGADGVASINLTQAFGVGDAAQGINPNATTGLSPLVNVTNNGEEDLTVTIAIDSVSGGPSGFDAADVKILDASGNDITNTGQTVASGTTLQFGMEFDLQSDDVDLSDTSSFTVNINITATSN